MKRMIMCVCSLILAAGFIFALTPKEQMVDAFGRGFAAAKEQKRDEAIAHFTEAGNTAIQIGEWQGCLDAANAIATMGNPAGGVQFIDAALSIARQKRDWRIAVACGYAYGSLPADLGNGAEAVQAFSDAGSFAASKKDWMGLSEAANGLINIDDPGSALPFLDQAFTMAQSARSIEGCNTLIAIFERIGDTDRQMAVEQFKSTLFKSEKYVRPKIAPPEGWSPVGESVASPKIPDKDQQLAAWDAANKEIQSKRDYEAQQEQLKLEREKLQVEREKNAARYAYANAYRNYYYFPYGHADYGNWGWNEIGNWADHYYSGYTYVDGYYTYNSGYSGFGFEFGYSDGYGSSFAFGIYSD